ncbi:glutaminase domain-containing protein [Kitasatospora viridis]|uniref:Uncharacterized protein DUF4964 n=1 Tax=Kitasatospora viridis TaxID=281105 RepID=A0A561SFR3_9ACTN|nr:DUF5127 domain-containing protein [Kitasatospora viridis]TWF73678.1 uncharacterized protein DUF4964 [Kitasatospora viridis]
MSGAKVTTPVPQLSRRSLLLAAATTALAGNALAGGLAATRADAATPGATPAFTPLRPPAVPLAVRSPYLSTWQAGDNLAGTWSTFWNGHVTAFCGIARIDGTGYLFAGNPQQSLISTSMTQVSLQLTATRSIYTFTAGGVTLTVTFFSPVDLNNLQRQSVPFSYVSMQAVANDGGSHSVQLHLDISGEWAHGDITQAVNWAQQQTANGNVALTFTPTNPSVLAQSGDQASWGSVVLTTAAAPGVSWQIGTDLTVRSTAISSGTLPGTVDANQPRAIDNSWPVLGFCRDLGPVGATPSAEFVVAVGHVRTPALSYLGGNLNAWWSTYWPGTSGWTDMVDWFLADYGAALSAATALDTRIQNDATAAVGGGSVGANYAALCALALRQAVAGTELAAHGGSPWAFLKEISSDGNVSTVDVIYPALPLFLYFSPSYLQLLLAPILAYCEQGGWPEPFAVHDLGSNYPVADGHNNGKEEDMPVEESANMLIMCAALLQQLAATDAAAFAQAHYTILKQWADYLVGNALDPGSQLSTDDFASLIVHNANLALKGIIGIGAMGIVAGFAGNTADQAKYAATARGYISQWLTNAQDPNAAHLDLAYGSANTWGLKYNGFADQLLGLDLVPAGVASQEAAWYQANAGGYGVMLDGKGYTKADWELWTAAWLRDQGAIRDTLVNGVYAFADTSPQRAPFGDWYDVSSGANRTFEARPVVGGVFSLVAPRTASAVSWHRIQNQHSGKLLAVSLQSLLDNANVTQWSDNGSPDHLWTVVDNGDGTVKIYNRATGKLLAVQDQSLADGALVRQYYDNGTPDHLWRLVDAGGGWSKIVNVHSGKVMAVQDQSLTDGAQVTQWTDNGSPDHLWRLV